MSRIGKEPIKVPQGVEIKIAKDAIKVKGPKGELTVAVHPKIEVNYENDTIQLERVDNSRIAREQYGLRRTLLNNAVIGVHKGFEKTLEVLGVGYKVDLQGKTIVLNVGYSHPVKIDLPKGIDAKIEKSKITLSGIDKQGVGELAAVIRRVRPPEPYKGKGIKYENEQIRRKAGKSGGK
ncbi:50S ribosomal protein L6 [Desulfonatronovibrio magnus]|uniref:50S ribosomal protein L6 n=1 Tax=Desulfonatronovibrio magnus TaxID=698827 RepID=UPI0005EB8AFE|nr:50S ribosomal protein L6 [Desulfonatronovibrio magnus]